MDYARELLKAVNTYSDNNMGSREHLRDLVCIISENSKLKSDPFISKLLYLASQKMRVFGYNIQNGFTEDPDVIVRPMEALKNEAIKQSYRSKVWSNNILDKTQKEIVDFFQSLECKRMLVSAPTSYGKTFLMREILYLNNNRYNNILLVFPTIALLRENATEMTRFVKDKGLEYSVIKSVDGAIDPEGRNIFVFTPERTIQLLSLYPHLKLDFFFYDEVYKIDEDYCNDEEDEDEKVNEKVKSTPNVFDDTRAKTFRIALYLLSKIVPEYYLAGPNLNRDNFGLGMKTYLLSNNVSVREVSFEPTIRITVKAYKNKIIEEYPLLPPSPQITALSPKKNDRITDIVSYINIREYGKTMLYCTTPAKANEYAGKLAMANAGKTINDKRFKSFLDHIKRTYDINGSAKEWSLINILEKGFAVHHGKLPKYVQTEILEQFNHGEFDVLFCTSTIVEGVNTKAKNMVILNSRKGREPLTPFDIKNIKGRAGRYYHNFVGRIFYADEKLLEIENSDTSKLNFATYDNPELDGVDLDNAKLSDLTSNNAASKKARIELQRNFLLPRNIFKKNRLVPYEHQEKLLQLFLKNSEEFDKFRPLIGNYDLTNNFLKFNYLGKVLDSFEQAGLIDEPTKKRYAVVGKSYYQNGFNGILAYEINNARDPNAKRRTTIDRAYTNAFKTLKDIIEHKIPKAISLFECIYLYAAEQKGLSGFSLSKVTRFYETGVRSAFGEELFEFGFPTDTIRRIEGRFSELLSLDISQSKNFYLRRKDAIHFLLDSYEKYLIEKAVESMLRS